MTNVPTYTIELYTMFTSITHQQTNSLSMCWRNMASISQTLYEFIIKFHEHLFWSNSHYLSIQTTKSYRSRQFCWCVICVTLAWSVHYFSCSRSTFIKFWSRARQLSVKLVHAQPSWRLINPQTYRQISNISPTQSPNIDVSRLVLQLALLNPLKPGVRLRMKM